MKHSHSVLVFVILALLAIGGASCTKQTPPEPEPVVSQPPEATGAAAPTGEAVKIGILTNAIAPFGAPMVVGMERAAEDPTIMPELGGGAKLPADVEAAIKKTTEMLVEAKAADGLPPCEASWKGPQEPSSDISA